MGKQPRKVGVLLFEPDRNSIIDPWELVFLQYFLEKSRYHILNIRSDEPDQKPNDKSPISIPGWIYGEKTNMGREISREIDALIIPGVQIANRLSGNSFDSDDHPPLSRNLKSLLREVYRRHKPIGASGITVKYLAAAISDLAESPLTITVGNDPRMENLIERRDCVAVNTRDGEVIIDESNSLVTTAGHFGEQKITTVYKGMENLVTGLISLIKQPE
jgi:enhancing lycopene biosynthesis protein 2